MSPLYLPTLPLAESDDSLQHRIVRALRAARIAESNSLYIRVERGAATLRGTVGSFHRQLIIRSTVRQVPGVNRLIEQIEVAEPVLPREYVAGSVRRTA